MPRVVRLRPEWFGGIVQVEDPPALLYVDRPYLIELGAHESELWKGEDPERLAAPTEVHLTLTRRCGAGCTGCYTASTPKGKDLPFAYWTGIIDQLAAMGVFHVAMGGGESTLRADLFELAAYTRSKGIVPNLTTHGLDMTPAMARACRVFGQINISVDGVGAVYEAVRGFDGFPQAHAALGLLKGEGIRPGINCVVTRQNVDFLEDLVRYANRENLSEIEFLRYKPAGRARSNYAEVRVDPERHRRFIADMRRWADAFAVKLKIDCSFVPFLCDAKPDPALLEKFGVTGCEAGNVLAAVQPEGTWSTCSFVTEPAGQAEEMAADWKANAQAEGFRTFTGASPAPCATCHYLEVCRGGCKVVSEFVTGNRFAPDPECPRVIAHQKQF